MLKEISQLKNQLSFINDIDSIYEVLKICNEIIDDEVLDEEYIQILDSFSLKVDEFELKNILNQEDDIRSSIISIHPGAGGTESQDWAQMLYRMYSRWIEKKGFKSKLLDYQEGDEAGIKDVSIEVSGDYSYGYLKSEKGVHRLVRISPFDSNGKRHTSFASVFVYPLIEDEIDIEINDKDLKIDTYRASGAGGQHVNKTDSAVRLTHLPTGIVVECQDERSQHKNKARAMSLLQAKLVDKARTEQISEQAETRRNLVGTGDRSEKIRTYNFPAGRVPDHRINLTLHRLNQVMTGELDPIIDKLIMEHEAEMLRALSSEQD